MPDLLVRKRQLAVIAEGTKGTFNTALNTPATAATNANFHLVDPSFRPRSLSFDRNIRHPTLTPVSNFKPGVASFELTHGVELAGHTDNPGAGAYVEPPIGPLLDAAGFQGLAVAGWTISSFSSGTEFEHGETITGGTSSATATVVGSTVDTIDTLLYYSVASLSGTFSTGETVTGGTSGTTAVMTGIPATATRWAWQPVSDHSAMDTVSMNYYVDGKIWKLKGARANVEFVFEHANRGLANFTWTGIIEDVVDGALLTGATKPVVDHYTPPAFLGVNLGFDDGTNALVLPKFNRLSLAMNSDAILRENSNDADGWDYALISGRAPTMTVNPDEELEATHSFYDGLKAGTNYQARFTYGSTAANRFTFRLPAAQLDDMTEGDRDGATTWDMTWRLSGGTGPSGALGVDNEVVIING